MGNKLENNKDFEKVEVSRTLFNRCSLEELQAIEIMVNNGTVRGFLAKKIRDQEQRHLEAENIVGSAHIESETLNTKL